MTCSPSESTHLFHKNASFDTELTRGSSHELYIYANTLDMYHNFAPKFPGRYLTSNVNITVPGPDGSPISVPVGSQLQLGRDRTHFLMICLIRRSLRQVQDTKVSCTPRNDTADNLSSRARRGRKVTSLGVLFDFTGNDHNTTVQKVENMVKEAWVS